jgi:hypothetical protein
MGKQVPLLEDPARRVPFIGGETVGKVESEGVLHLAPRGGEVLQDGEDGMSLASVKLTASGLRHWLDFLTERGVLEHNPARSVRTPRLVVREGKTPVMDRDQGRRLFAALDAAAATGDLRALRDRALMALMLYGFVRVGAAVAMRVRDFEDEGEHANLEVPQFPLNRAQGSGADPGEGREKGEARTGAGARARDLGELGRPQGTVR